MARPSKLTEKQWNDVLKAHLDGEAIRSLSRKYNVAESAIRARISAQSKTIKKLANQIVETERDFQQLPINAQCAVISLADELKAISIHLASSAKHGAMASSKLNSMMHAEVQRFQDGAEQAILAGESPLTSESVENLKGIGALSRLANSASEIGLNLLKANKEAIDDITKNSDKPEPKQIIFTVADARA